MMSVSFRSGMLTLPFALLLNVLTCRATIAQAGSSDDPFESLAQRYEASVRQVVDRYCADCHATDDPQGELDLERFATLAEVRRSPQSWLRVVELLDDRQMPPSDAPQPSDEERRLLRDWTRDYLDAEALAGAGDPGPVVLRRLSNSEYTYTIQDLTGLPLEPAREFPVDGAAGEGFTNTGQALVMSPALLAKYLDAAKEVARHVVPLHDGIRFAPGTTRRDWTDEILHEIRGIYGRYAQADGTVPWSNYFAALVEEHRALAAGETERVAQERGLSPRYLAELDRLLSLGPDGNANWAFLQSLAELKKAGVVATEAERGGIIARMVNEVTTWHQVLVRKQNVGHLKPWMVPLDPIVDQVALALPVAQIGDQSISVTMQASDAGDGSEGDVVVWRRPRLVGPGMAELPLSELPRFHAERTFFRDRFVAETERALAALATVSDSDGSWDRDAVAAQHEVTTESLAAWAAVLGMGDDAPLELDRMTSPLENASGYNFVRGWGSHDTPLLLASSGANDVRIPGMMRAGQVTVHPSPTLSACVGWRSPITGAIQIKSIVTHAHLDCGNGVTWAIEWRRGKSRQQLASGLAVDGTPVHWASQRKISVREGDLVSLVIGPRDGNHACDLTEIELEIEAVFEAPEGEAAADDWRWKLSSISSYVHEGNPLRDLQQRPGVWEIYTEPLASEATAARFPVASALAHWSTATDDVSRQELAAQVAKLLKGEQPVEADSPDAQLKTQLLALASPHLEAALSVAREKGWGQDSLPIEVSRNWGLSADRFGGEGVDLTDLVMASGESISFTLPGDLGAGLELRVAGTLHPARGTTGSVQLQLLANPNDAQRGLSSALPIVAIDPAVRERFSREFQDFRRAFPAGLCYMPIVPVDEVVTLALFVREDEPLMRTMLTLTEHARLTRLWDELHFVSQDALTQVDAFQQLMEYATQDSDPSLFEPYREPMMNRAAAFREELEQAVSHQLDAICAFASVAYRRPLTDAQRQELFDLHARLRAEGIGLDEALQLVMARVLVAPEFLYRLEVPGEGAEATPIDDYELATRLSYFLWSSTPDQRLLDLAAAGRLREPEVLAGETRRMLADERVRRLAIEFACQWLHVRDFATLDEKSERHFPTFAEIRDELAEEPVLFFTDLFREDRSVRMLLDADYTFLNESLAEHYGIEGVTGDEWRRVDGVRAAGRGGILGFGATLAMHSGASRTSPILRGNWVSEVVLGERLPRPPAGVPPIPEDESELEGLTVRQIVEKHSSDERCIGCHKKVDPFGYALEGFDAIGRLRTVDLGDRPIDTATILEDGTPVDGMSGLRDYLNGPRRGDVLRVFSRKLLGYALGRSTQLSDRPTIDRMVEIAESDDPRFSRLVEIVVTSPQFLSIRGRDSAVDQGDPNASTAPFIRARGAAVSVSVAP